MAETNLDQVRLLIDQLSFEDKLNLVEYLARQLRRTPERAPKTQELYGMWRGQIPDDFDLESALKDIRHEWEKEWPQVFEK